MGSQHKLLLPWVGSMIIEHVLKAWLSSRIDGIVLVSRPDDATLHKVVRKFSTVQLVIPSETPADMKRSIQLGLEHLQAAAPTESDRWLIAPADLPTMTPSLIDRVITGSRETSAIVAPKFGQRRGHPVSFPWSLASQVAQLGEAEGINRLLEQSPVHWLHVSADQYPDDVDDQDDYQRLLRDQDAGPSQ